LSSIILSSCGNTQEFSSNNPNYYDPSLNIYNPNNAASDLSKRAVDGVRPKLVMKNVYLKVHKELGVLIHDLFGELVSKVQTEPVNFDDVNSFDVNVHQAKLTMAGKDMDNLMKFFVLNYPGAPLKDLKHTIKAGGRINIQGKMKQAGLDVSFEMEGPIRATPEGLMILDPDTVKTLGIPAKGIMDLFGIETQKLINLNEQRGLKLVGNSILMYPSRLFPPPTMNGKVFRVETENDALHIYFDDGTKLKRPPLPIQEGIYKNYKHIYGGAIRMMGNETHEDTNILMIDMNQSNPFEFYLSEYYNHSIAGQVQMLNRKGSLINYMPDYSDIPKRLGRIPKFDNIDSGLSNEKWRLNPESDPGLDKRKGWASQPAPQPVNQYPR
jgi:hypothetical protein